VVVQSIWILVLAALVVVGCSTTNEATARSYASCTQLRNESEEISGREQQCIRAALIRSNDQTAQIAASPGLNSNTGVEMQNIVNDRDRELSKCKANADHEEEELSVCQRADYESRAKDERERSALMMILTTSQPH
jgi:hypothetical protein